MNIEEASAVWDAYMENVKSINNKTETIDHVHLVNNIWTYRTQPEKHLCIVMVFENDDMIKRHLRSVKLTESEIAKFTNDDTRWIHALE